MLDPRHYMRGCFAFVLAVGCATGHGAASDALSGVKYDRDRPARAPIPSIKASPALVVENPEHVGLKGAVLGMALSEFRAVPLSDPAELETEHDAKHRLVGVYCQGDGADFLSEYGIRSVPELSDNGKWSRECFYGAIKQGRGLAWFVEVSTGFAGSKTRRAGYEDGAATSVRYVLYPSDSANPVLGSIVVSLPVGRFQDAIDALEGRYGPAASVETEEYRNGFGQPVYGRYAAWVLPGVTIQAAEKVGTKTQSIIVFASDDYVSTSAAHKERHKKELGDDL